MGGGRPHGGTGCRALWLSTGLSQLLPQLGPGPWVGAWWHTWFSCSPRSSEGTWSGLHCWKLRVRADTCWPPGHPGSKFPGPEVGWSAENQARVLSPVTCLLHVQPESRTPPPPPRGACTGCSRLGRGGELLLPSSTVGASQGMRPSWVPSAAVGQPLRNLNHAYR